MVMTVLSMSLMTAPVKAASDYEAGDLIKMDGLSSVYYYADNGKRYVFPDENTYFSWYSDFSGVVTIPQSELESIPIGGNVTMRPGTNLVKITTDPKVYAVEDGGKLVHVADEDTASSLYGEDWADRVVDVPDSFFVNYTQTDEEVSGADYPQGSLVNVDGEVYYITEDGARSIDDEAAFEANRFQWRNVNEAPADYDLPSVGDPITEAEEALIDTAQTAGDGGTTGPVGSGLTVALSNNTAESATLPKGAAKVAFTTINLTASNDGAVTVEDLIIDRIGVGDETNLGDVYLYEGMTKVGDGESISNDDEAEFLGLDYEVPAGETKTLTVRANVLGEAGNHGFAISEASDVVTDGATVSGSFPVRGNLMSLSSVESGNVTFDFTGSVSNPKVGEEDKKVAEFDLSAGDEEKVDLQAVTLTNEGSADTEDAMKNFKLYVGGDVVAELESTDSDEVTMILDEAYEIEDGKTETFTLKADIESEATESVDFQLDAFEDVVAQGKKYGYYVGVYNTNFNGVDSLPIGADISVINGSSNSFTIETGELTVSEADSNPTSKDVARGKDDVTFLIAELKAEDESLTITDLMVDVELSGASGTSTGNDYLDNVTLYLDGKRVAGPDDFTSFDGDMTTTSIPFDDELDLNGTHELEVQADVTDYAAYGNYVMTIESGKMSVEDANGDSIGTGEINGDAQGNTVTVASPQPTLSKDSTYSSQDVVAGEEILVGKYFLNAGDSEALEIDKYQVDLNFGANGASTTLSADEIEDLRVNDEDYISSPDDSNDFYVDEELAAGEDKVIEIYLTISDDADAYYVPSTITTDLIVEGEGKTSGGSVSETDSGQTMTLREGVLTVSTDSATPDAALMLAEGSGDVAAWKFETENTSYTISEVEITAYNNVNPTSTNVNGSAVTSMTFDGVTDNTPSNGVFEFDTDIEVAKDSNKKLTASALFNDINNLDVANDTQVQFAITGYTAKAGNESTETEYTSSELTLEDLDTDELMEVYDSKITAASSKGDSTRLESETYIMEVEVSNDGGENDSDAVINELVFDTSVVGTGTTTGVDLEYNGTSVASSTSESSDVWTIEINEDGNIIGSGNSKTYELILEVSGIGTDDYGTAKLTDVTWDDDNYYSEENTWIDGTLVDGISSKTFELER